MFLGKLDGHNILVHPVSFHWRSTLEVSMRMSFVASRPRLGIVVYSQFCSLYCRVRTHLGGMEPQHGGGPIDHDLFGT